MLTDKKSLKNMPNRQLAGELPLPQLSRGEYGAALAGEVEKLLKTKLTQKQAGIVAAALYNAYQLGYTHNSSNAVGILLESQRA